MNSQLYLYTWLFTLKSSKITEFLALGAFFKKIGSIINQKFRSDRWWL